MANGHMHVNIIIIVPTIKIVNKSKVVAVY